MTHSSTESSNPSPRPRRTKIIVAWMACIVTIAALAWYRERIDFEILRFRTKSSFVIVSDDRQQTAFSLDEKQTRDLLNVINNRTHSTLARRSVIYGNWVAVFCKDSGSAYLRSIWVHAFESKSLDVLEELFKTARRGVPEDSESVLERPPPEKRDLQHVLFLDGGAIEGGAHDDLFENTTMTERVY